MLHLLQQYLGYWISFDLKTRSICAEDEKLLFVGTVTVEYSAVLLGGNYATRIP